MAVSRVAIDCEDCFLREDFGGLGLLGPRTAHAGGIFGSMRSSGLLWPSLGWRLALQGVCGLGIRGLLWGFRFQKTSGVASHLRPEAAKSDRPPSQAPRRSFAS